MSGEKQIRLSPSSLGDFRRCPRCWWMDKVKKIPAPRGIFPSLPGGMDRVIKARWDHCRSHSIMPPELSRDVVIGTLFPDQGLLNRWRNWRSGLAVTVDEATLSGALDDLLFDPSTGLYTVLDAKTKGSPPKPGDTERYYQLQADCYALMLKGNARPARETAYFCYFWPASAESTWEFSTELVWISIDPARAEQAIRDAVATLKSTEIPAPGAGCEMCAYVEARK